MAYFRIKEIALEKGMNLKDVAKSVGITPSCFSSIVTGKAWPRLETLEKIAKAINVRVEDLFVTNNNEKEYQAKKEDCVEEISFACPHCGKTINIKIQTS